MPERNTVVRSLHDLGLAAWFGGTLAGAVGLNGAAGETADPAERLVVANAGWARWTPVNLAAIGIHLVGATGLLVANRRRVVGQKGVGASTVTKTVLTGAALAVTAYSRVLGATLQSHDGAPAEGATEPAPDTPVEATSAQAQLRGLQWAVPALTGALVVLNALHGEQQKPARQVAGVVGRAARLVGAVKDRW